MKPKILIAGAGQTGRNLAERLRETWEVTVIDPEESKLSILNAYPEIKTIKGDASSALTIRKSSPSEIDYMVVCTGSDDANLEIIDTARREGITRIIGVVVNYNREEEYLKRKVEILNRSKILAEMLESKIGKGKVVASEIGLGKGEIVEVKVLPGSILAGKKLKNIHPKKWIVGAIYRDDKLIVPHGETIIKGGDKVVLIGDPVIVKMIGDLLRTGAPEFPLQFGAEAFVFLSSDFFKDEIQYLFNRMKTLLVRVSGIENKEFASLFPQMKIVFHPEVKTPLDSIPLIKNEDTGIAIFPKFPVSKLHLFGLRKHTLISILDSIEVPLLITGGTFPYKNITLLFATLIEETETVTEIAIDITRLFRAHLSVTAVIPPSFIRDEKLKTETEESLEEAGSVALMHGMKITHVCLEGNPVREGVKLSESSDLIILPRKRGTKNTIFNPDVASHIALRAKCSVLILPLK